MVSTLNNINDQLHAMVSLRTGKNVATLADQMEPIQHACPVCGNVYLTRTEALKCRDKPFEDGDLTVGTIVAVPGKSSQFPPDDPWMAFIIPPDPESDSHFHRAGYRVPLFVVTAIHGEPRSPHRCVVTLVSLVGSHLTTGWTPATGEGHLALFRIDGGKHCDVDSTWIDRVKDLLVDCNPSDKMREQAKRLARIGISSDDLL